MVSKQEEEYTFISFKVTQQQFIEQIVITSQLMSNLFVFLVRVVKYVH